MVTLKCSKTFDFTHDERETCKKTLKIVRLFKVGIIQHDPWRENAGKIAIWNQQHSCQLSIMLNYFDTCCVFA